MALHMRSDRVMGKPYLVRHNSTDLVQIGRLDPVRQHFSPKLYLVRQQLQLQVFFKTVSSTTGKKTQITRKLMPKLKKVIKQNVFKI